MWKQAERTLLVLNQATCDYYLLQETKSVIHMKTQLKNVAISVNAEVTKYFNVNPEPYKRFIDCSGSYVVCQTKEEYEDYITLTSNVREIILR